MCDVSLISYQNCFVRKVLTFTDSQLKLRIFFNILLLVVSYKNSNILLRSENREFSHRKLRWARRLLTAASTWSLVFLTHLVNDSKTVLHAGSRPFWFWRVLVHTLFYCIAFNIVHSLTIFEEGAERFFFFRRIAFNKLSLAMYKECVGD